MMPSMRGRAELRRVGWLSVRVCFPLAALLASLAGCGESRGPDLTPAFTTTVPPTATPQQVAAVVAKHAPDLRSGIGDVQSCRSLTAPSCDRGLIGLHYRALGFQARALGFTMENLEKPGSTSYVGRVPPELEQLVEDTTNAARAVMVGADQYAAEGCDQEPALPSCAGANDAFHIRLNDLNGRLDAWVAYGKPPGG